ncbi:MAG TPA: transposase, partial [Novosphingobium sp.]|nr:transposase [Novosphingobium sp.]
MPCVIATDETAACALAECIDALSASGFHPDDEGNLEASARLLARLGNDRAFLGDLLVAELAAGHREEQDGNAYGAQSLVLSPPGTGNWFLRANIWPSKDEHALRASGG